MSAPDQATVESFADRIADGAGLALVPERERVRKDMAEPYRTLLGHFRHEVGHYYWSV